MKLKCLAIALILTAVPLHAAHASNPMLLLNQSDLNQLAVIETTGNANLLVIVQQSAAAEAGNRINVSIVGDGNGGPEGRNFSGQPAELGLTPGNLTQIGFGNAIEVTVTGERNLFAVAQLGNSNTVRAAITGSHNQAAVMQTGVGNFTSIAQSGVGNSISVQQTTW
ncbi:hypothetical protein ACFSX5_13675 [Devosia albogilva]|uniref:Curlin n=1 Tax=Devosia albogilva TaxID=429726 RepID=A0ABW5QNE6_9HYPH